MALVQLPARVRRALRLFRKITGQTAVASLATALPEPGGPVALSPPVHPRCAGKLRSIPAAPCGEQWSLHLRSSLHSSRAHSHTCPIGLRCSCVPIHFGGRLVGVAKLVADDDTSDATFTTARTVLNLAVAETCHASAVAVLSDEVRALRRRIADLQKIRTEARPGAGDRSASDLASRATANDSESLALVDRVLAFLQEHHHDPALSLRTVAAAMRCNPRYLTSRFTQIVGEHMHTYLISLRVSRARGLLLETDASIKEIAHASGFSGPGRLAGAFRTHVGVSPREYRRIFAGS